MMKPELRDRVYKIAADTRTWAEEYNKGYTDGGFDKDLCGMCAIASAELFRRLEAANIKVRLGLHKQRDGYGAHCFAIVANHVVDITATQFNRKAIEIVPLSHAKVGLEYWEPTLIFDTVDDLIQEQYKMDWDDEGLAFHDEVEDYDDDE